MPAFWTNTSQITFNFTGFQPAYPGQALQYQWGLGTTPNSTNTIPFTTFTGDQILNTIFVTNGQLLRNVTVFQQTYSLSNATALVEGQEYYVTVQAFCNESAAAATATQSAIVKVRLTSVVCGLLTSAMCDLLISVVCELLSSAVRDLLTCVECASLTSVVSESPSHVSLLAGQVARCSVSACSDAFHKLPCMSSSLVVDAHDACWWVTI